MIHHSLLLSRWELWLLMRATNQLRGFSKTVIKLRYVYTLIIKFRKGFNLKRAWLKFQKLSPQKKSHLYSWSLRSRLTPNPTRPIRRLPARGVKRSKCSDSTIINEWLPPRRLGMTIGHIETVLSKKQNGISTNDPRYSVWYVHYIFVRTPSTKVDSDSFFTNFCRNLMFHVYISQNLDDLHWKPPSPSIFPSLHFALQHLESLVDPSHWVIGLTFWRIPTSPNRGKCPAPPPNPAWWKLSVMTSMEWYDMNGTYLSRNFQLHLRDMELSRQEKWFSKAFPVHFPQIFLEKGEWNHQLGGRKKNIFKKNMDDWGEILRSAQVLEALLLVLFPGHVVSHRTESGSPNKKKHPTQPKKK